MRLPGCKNERGTQVGASRRIPSVSVSASAASFATLAMRMLSPKWGNSVWTPTALHGRIGEDQASFETKLPSTATARRRQGTGTAEILRNSGKSAVIELASREPCEG